MKKFSDYVMVNEDVSEDDKIVKKVSFHIEKFFSARGIEIRLKLTRNSNGTYSHVSYGKPKDSIVFGGLFGLLFHDVDIKFVAEYEPMSEKTTLTFRFGLSAYDYNEKQKVMNRKFVFDSYGDLID